MLYFSGIFLRNTVALFMFLHMADDAVYFQKASYIVADTENSRF